MTLAQMRDVDIRTVDVSTLTEINNLFIDAELPQPKRCVSFVRQTGNPYCALVNGVPVKFAFLGLAPITDLLGSAIDKSQPIV